MVDPLATEKKFLKQHQKELSAQFPGKYLLLKGEEVFGGYETYEEGVKAGARLFGSGQVLVRSVLHPEDADAPDIPALSIGIPFSART